MQQSWSMDNYFFYAEFLQISKSGLYSIEKKKIWNYCPQPKLKQTAKDK